MPARGNVGFVDPEVDRHRVEVAFDAPAGRRDGSLLKQVVEVQNGVGVAAPREQFEGPVELDPPADGRPAGLAGRCAHSGLRFVFVHLFVSGRALHGWILWLCGGSRDGEADRGAGLVVRPVVCRVRGLVGALVVGADPDAAVVAFDDAPAGGQADAGSLVALAGSFAVEEGEDLLPRVGGYADAVGCRLARASRAVPRRPGPILGPEPPAGRRTAIPGLF